MILSLAAQHVSRRFDITGRILELAQIEQRARMRLASGTL